MDITWIFSQWPEYKTRLFENHKSHAITSIAMEHLNYYICTYLFPFVIHISRVRNQFVYLIISSLFLNFIFWFKRSMVLFAIALKNIWKKLVLYYPFSRITTNKREKRETFRNVALDEFIPIKYKNSSSLIHLFFFLASHRPLFLPCYNELKSRTCY